MMDSRPPGYPIRLFGYLRMLAPPPDFLQLTTAFFAITRQGIHLKPLFRLTILLSHQSIAYFDYFPSLYFYKYHVLKPFQP